MVHSETSPDSTADTGTENCADDADAGAEMDDSTTGGTPDRAASDDVSAVLTSLPNTVPITTILAEEQTMPFCGLTPEGDAEYPEAVAWETDSTRFSDSDDRLSLKEVIQTLPKAGEGNLWADNEFVTSDGAIDTAALRDIHGLDCEQLEADSDHSLEELTTKADPDARVPIEDHKDIIDRRRLALHTLGYDVKFRWQIASDRYDAGDPQALLLPMIGAFQQCGATDAFGWCRFRDWGGEVKLTVICPSLAHEVTPPEEFDDVDDLDSEITGLTTTRSHAREMAARLGTPSPDTDDSGEDSEADEGDNDPNADTGITIYHGYQLGYDFRGTQTVWAKPLIFIPGPDVTIPGVGRRYSRRHVGDLTDATHERDQDRVPIMKWHRALYDDQQKRATAISRDVLRSRLLAIEFDDLPFDAPEFYEYVGLPWSYAEEAAERATTLATPPTCPTLWNLQLSLKLVLLDQYDGSQASDRYQEFQELAGQLLRQPGQMVKLALREHELRVDDEDGDTDEQGVLPDDQAMLSDAIDDLVEIPGVSAGSEADLSVVESQQVENHVQQRLSDLS